MRAKEMPISSRSRYKVLMIEDNESISDILRFILEREGFEVESVADGLAGEKLIGRAPPPHVILLDVSLPFIDGFQLVRNIRNDRLWEHVPVIMLSGHPQKSFIDQSIRAGANEYIVKPFQREELIRCIYRLVTTSDASEPTQ
jgi:DNA-binding response OmpR family regulator